MKFQDYWLTVGRISDKARSALDLHRCVIRDVSRENPSIALVYFPHNDESLTIDFDDNLSMRDGMNESELYISLEDWGSSRGSMELVWRSTWGDCQPERTSITETELITYEEWEQVRARMAQKVVDGNTVESSPLLIEG